MDVNGCQCMSMANVRRWNVHKLQFFFRPLAAFFLNSRRIILNTRTGSIQNTKSGSFLNTRRNKIGKSTGKNAAPQNLGPHFVRACAREMHFNIFTKVTLSRILHEKCRAPESAQNAYTHTHFARACAVEMHANISQEPPNAEICTKNVAPQNLGPHITRAILYKNFTIRATLSRN